MKLEIEVCPQIVSACHLSMKGEVPLRHYACALVQATSSQGTQCAAAAVDSSEPCKPASATAVTEQGAQSGAPLSKEKQEALDFKRSILRALRSPCDPVAALRMHVTGGRDPAEMLAAEEAGSGGTPESEEEHAAASVSSSHSSSCHGGQGTAPFQESNGQAAQNLPGAAAPAGGADTVPVVEEAGDVQAGQAEPAQEPGREELLGLGMQWLQAMYRVPAAESAEPVQVPDSLLAVKSLLPGVPMAHNTLRIEPSLIMHCLWTQDTSPVQACLELRQY